MTNPVDCRSIEESLPAAASGSLPSAFADHVRSCADCARTVRRDHRLAQILSSLPAAPPAAFEAPALPARRGGRLLPFPAPRWVAAAAAVAVVAVGWLWSGQDTRIRVGRVIDVAGAPPQVDERLLALTFGAEAVAMRRPTETR